MRHINLINLTLILLLSVADPTQKLTEINLVLQGEYSGENLNVKEGKTHLKIELPKEGEAGKTVTIELML